MHHVTNPDPDIARAALDAAINLRCQIAFSGGCRLAVNFARCPDGCCWEYDFVVLSPGESAPRGWTIYEERGGIAVGRSA